MLSFSVGRLGRPTSSLFGSERLGQELPIRSTWLRRSSRFCDFGGCYCKLSSSHAISCVTSLASGGGLTFSRDLRFLAGTDFVVLFHRRRLDCGLATWRYLLGLGGFYDACRRRRVMYSTLGLTLSPYSELNYHTSKAPGLRRGKDTYGTHILRCVLSS
jgi:hypothetical protein